MTIINARTLLVGSFAVAVILNADARTPSALRSPWDLHPVVAKAGTYACPAPPPLPKDIEASSFYSDSKHSIIDPARLAAYNAARKRYLDTMRAAENTADAYQKTGNRGAAECVLQILDSEAAASAMTGAMSSNQAHYVQNWTLGSLAVSWLKVRSAEPGTSQQRDAAIAWMKDLAGQTRDYFTMRHAKGTNDGTNNHYYWAGFAVMGAAISSNDRALYEWARGTFEEAVSRVASDGTLPLEMARGQRALHYHLFALGPIVMMAEFGEANGEDLYASDDHALQRLAERTISGLKNNSYFSDKAGVAQDTPNASGLDSDDIIWMVPYLHRFPNADGTRMLHATKLKPFDYLGGYPPGWSAKSQ
jgi:poly(beta-D-mannuronate) lyase